MSNESLDAIMNADPEDISSQDLDLLIHALREQRTGWAKEEKIAKTEGRKPKAPALKWEGPMEIGDLNLKL